MQKSKKFMILSLLLILLCCISVASASENVTEEVSLASDDTAVNEVVSEVDSDDESITDSNDEYLEFADDSGNESLAVQDEEPVNDVKKVDSTLTEENDNGQTLLSFSISDSILGDGKPHDVIYVNASSKNNPKNFDGQNWTNAYGQVNGISRAVTDINDGGIIYLADVKFTQAKFGSNKNYTVIGFKDKTILTSFYSDADNYNNTIHTFINITFNIPSTKTPTIDNGAVFINCTFICSKFILNDIVATDSPQNTVNVTSSYLVNFTNCYFANSTIDGTFITANKFTQVNFNNCTFENITAESLIYSNTDGGREDGINIYDSTFKDINVIGVADIQQDYLLTFENNIYDSSVNVRTPEPVYTSISMKATGKGNITFTLTDENGNAIENATLIITGSSEPKEVKTDSNGQYVLTGIDDGVKVKATFNEVKYKYAASVSEDRAYNFTDLGKNVVISLENTTSGNKGIVKVSLKNKLNETVAKVNITYKVNGVEYNATADENGSFVISNLIGDNEIFVSFAGNESFDSKNITQKFIFPKVVTSLSATKVSATYNVAKNLVITLKDSDNNVLANKVVTVKVGSILQTLTTNAEGQVSVNIANLVPNTYSATFSFAGDDTLLASSSNVDVDVVKATPKLTAKKLTAKVKVKSKKVTATLKDNSGKVLKNTKVTLKIKGKTYTAKTNKKGVATFKVTKLNKKGTFKGTVKFAGNSYFNAISKKVTVVVKKYDLTSYFYNLVLVWMYVIF